MTRRTTEAYVAALEFVNQNLIEINGCGIIIDFENAMRAALKKVSPEIRVHGCLFHFMQAITRQMASMKSLYELIRTNADAKFLFRKFQSLALLPANLIKNEFVSLLKEALVTFKFNEFAPFVEYFKNQWLNRVKPVHFSVYKLSNKTTGQAEAYNGKVNKSFRTHGALFQFVEQLQKEEMVKSDQFSRDVTGIFQPDRRKAFDKKRAEIIMKYSTQLEDKVITPKQFLSIMANVNNEILYDEKLFFTDEVEIRLSNETVLMEGDDVAYVPPTDDDEIAVKASAPQRTKRKRNITETAQTAHEETPMQTRSKRTRNQTSTDPTMRTGSDNPTSSTKRRRVNLESDENSVLNVETNNEPIMTRSKRASTQKTSIDTTIRAESNRQVTQTTVNSNTKRATTRKNERHQGHVPTEDDSDSDASLDSDSHVYAVMERISRNGPAMLKLRKRFKELEKQETISIDPHCFKCILCCERKKNTILFPCLHQHTCSPCWIYYKIQQINNMPFDSTMDDEVAKPKCPVCRQDVDKYMEARN